MAHIHKFNVDNHNVGTCTICGEVRQFPLEKGGQGVILKEGKLLRRSSKKQRTARISVTERHIYYEKNKKAIIADLLSIGRTATRKKWGIPTGSSVHTLERRWLTTAQIAKIDSLGWGTPPPPATLGAAENGRLPPLPFFENTWDPTVQVKWLEVYSALATEAHNKG